jgi:hypothetical protein
MILGCGGRCPACELSEPMTAAAKNLGISRRTVDWKINEMNLAKKSGQAAEAGGGQRPFWKAKISGGKPASLLSAFEDSAFWLGALS